MKHGAKVKRCSNEDCTNGAVKGGVCKRHGAKVLKQSSATLTAGYSTDNSADKSPSTASTAATGPTTTALAKKKRKRESPSGNKVKKKFDGKRYQYRRICSADGCTNHAQSEGVCIRHGAKVKAKRNDAVQKSSYETTGTITNEVAIRLSDIAVSIPAVTDCIERIWSRRKAKGRKE